MFVDFLVSLRIWNCFKHWLQILTNFIMTPCICVPCCHIIADATYDPDLPDAPKLVLIAVNSPWLRTIPVLCCRLADHAVLWYGSYPAQLLGFYSLVINAGSGCGVFYVNCWREVCWYVVIVRQGWESGIDCLRSVRLCSYLPERI